MSGCWTGLIENIFAGALETATPEWLGYWMLFFSFRKNSQEFIDHYNIMKLIIVINKFMLGQQKHMLLSSD